MAYSVNGKAPFFKSGQEARAYAIANPSLARPAEWGKDGTTVSWILFEDKIVGRCCSPPKGLFEVDVPYWNPSDCATVYPLATDGSYDPDDIHQVCLEPKVWLRPTTRRADGTSDYVGSKKIPFESQERAFAWFHEKAGMGIESPVLDSEDCEIGCIMNIPFEGSKKTILFTKDKCREINPTGRIGKPFDIFAYKRMLAGKERVLRQRRRVLSNKLHEILDTDGTLKGVERMFDEERGIHYMPNKRTGGGTRISEEPPKEEPATVQPVPVEPSEPLNLNADRNCQLVYGILLVKGRMNYNTLAKTCGHVSGWVKKHVDILKGLGLVETVKTGPDMRSPVECYVLADAPLPNGWDAESIVAMAQDYKPATQEGRASKGPNDDTFGADVIKAFSWDPVVLSSAIPAWEGFRQDLIKLDCRDQPEIKKIVKDLIRLSERRLSNISYICPVCGGKVSKTKTGVKCSGRCKIAIDGPDSKTAMEYLGLIAKGKRGVVE